MLSMGTSVRAEAFDWTFSGDRQPHFAELTGDEIAFLRLPCEAKKERLYEAYAALHPEFRAIMEREEMRRAWRMALILAEPARYEYESYCFFDDLIHAMHKHLPSTRWVTLFGYDLWEYYPDIVYCGRPVEEIDEVDRVGVEAVAELTEYGLAGLWLPGAIILQNNWSGNRWRNRIRLNPDVIYYLQRKLHDVTRDHAKMDGDVVPYLDPDIADKLTSQRKHFVDEAYQRGDYRAVLASTEPCQADSE